MNATNPIDEFTVDRESIGYVGRDLQRPECILAERDGTLWAADARGGVTRIAADGTQEFIGQRESAQFSMQQSPDCASLEAKFTQGTLPNGLAFAANGDIVIANFGTDVLEIMTRGGETRTLYDTIDGLPIGKVNFVLRDSKNRLWVTISTRTNPWTKAAASRVSDGYVAVVEGSRIRVVAEGLYFTNELRLDASEQWLYVVETTGPHISRMRLDESDPSEVRLVDREIFGPSHLGGMPDGIAFDVYGNLWCTLVMVDQLIALTPNGEKKVLLDDGNDTASALLLKRMASGTLQPQDMHNAHGTIAPWMASITFGGADLKTVYIGSLKGTRIPYFRSPVAGLPLVHWR
ncbi:SMP-30/gluconolactonase/LRE family protein [Caballeronia sp. GAFFF1]|uniref:SMP-30/gluconolactonase/LRE family protein n=1 Tax=Caballeronia sp. GAFFF1 TaxID=2921779 RepID=UPI002028CD08|nr:SMP-30/gluconolactonase/LRE family protein [Caballeronia sp. GAFFF1]